MVALGMEEVYGRILLYLYFNFLSTWKPGKTTRFGVATQKFAKMDGSFGPQSKTVFSSTHKGPAIK
jgi:hypothetical protein